LNLKSSRNRLIAVGAILLGIAFAALVIVVAGASGSGPAVDRTVGGVADGESAGLLRAEPDKPPTSMSPGSAGIPSTAVTPATGAAPATGDRLRISKIGVDAPLSAKLVGRDGQMPNPDTPDDVAWYDFSQWPGLGGAPGDGGNSVFSGHVDSGRLPCSNGTVPPPCRAVFWDLRRLEKGDEIIVLVGGRTFRYNVESNLVVNAATASWDDIVAATGVPSLTLITCAGNFDSNSRQYDMRQVVRAKRIG